MAEVHRDDLEQWEYEHDYRLIWQCPVCGYSYEERPGINEGSACPECGNLCRQSGESYC